MDCIKCKFSVGNTVANVNLECWKQWKISNLKWEIMGAVKHESGKHREMLHSNERLSGKCQILQINSGKQWKISNLNVGINMRCLKTVDVRLE